jgi:nucleotide-binding universal stress UspA family protein
MAPSTGALPPCLVRSASTILRAVGDRTTAGKEPNMTRIVVGIDASEDSLRALRWALQEAELRRASIELVHAYPIPELTAMPMIVTLPSDDELQKAAEQVLTDALATVGGAGDIPVTTTARAGSPAAVLCDVAGTRSCWSSARGVWAASAACCSARSATRSSRTARARSSPSSPRSAERRSLRSFGARHSLHGPRTGLRPVPPPTIPPRPAGHPRRAASCPWRGDPGGWSGGPGRAVGPVAGTG